jgi:hypothetical protein
MSAYHVVWNGSMHRADEVNNSLLGDGWRVKQTLADLGDHARRPKPETRGRPVETRRCISRKLAKKPTQICRSCGVKWRQQGTEGLCLGCHRENFAS